MTRIVSSRCAHRGLLSVFHLLNLSHEDQACSTVQKPNLDSKNQSWEQIPRLRFLSGAPQISAHLSSCGHTSLSTVGVKECTGGEHLSTRIHQSCRAVCRNITCSSLFLKCSPSAELLSEEINKCIPGTSHLRRLEQLQRLTPAGDVPHAPAW